MKVKIKNNNSNEAFAKRLKELRMQKGLSQKEFAKTVDIHPVHYNRYEKGATFPTAETLTRLADGLGVSVDYLLDGEEIDAAIANFEDRDLLKLFERLEKLPDEDKEKIKDVIDAFLMKKELKKQLAS